MLVEPVKLKGLIEGISKIHPQKVCIFSSNSKTNAHRSISKIKCSSEQDKMFKPKISEISLG